MKLCAWPGSVAHIYLFKNFIYWDFPGAHLTFDIHVELFKWKYHKIVAAVLPSMPDYNQTSFMSAATEHSSLAYAQILGEVLADAKFFAYISKFLADLIPTKTANIFAYANF